MALHRVQLPSLAHRLFRVVAMQRRLLRVLVMPNAGTAVIDDTWLGQLWPSMTATWIHQFGLGRQLNRIRVIASAPQAARSALYTEFTQQNRVLNHYRAGSSFTDLADLPGFTPDLTTAVTEFFVGCYEKLGHRTNANTGKTWPGYEFPQLGPISKQSYTESFRALPVTRSICPYCDRDLGTAVLEHYYPKAQFPLIACSPWNLFPVCDSCNKPQSQGGKGTKPPLTMPARHAAGWLHPIARPASRSACIRLEGRPPQVIPQLWSDDPIEQTALANHQRLIRSLATNWTHRAASYMEILITRAHDRRQRARRRRTMRDIVEDAFAECQENRGKLSNSLIDAAVCKAVLNERPGYNDEFADSNPPFKR